MIDYKEEYFKLLNKERKRLREQVLKGLRGKDLAIMQLIYLREDYHDVDWLINKIDKRIEELRKEKENEALAKVGFTDFFIRLYKCCIRSFRRII